MLPSNDLLIMMIIAICSILMLCAIVELFMLCYIYKDMKFAKTSSMVISCLKVLVFGESALDFYLNAHDRIAVQITVILSVMAISAVKRAYLLLTLKGDDEEFKLTTSNTAHHTR